MMQMPGQQVPPGTGAPAGPGGDTAGLDAATFERLVEAVAERLFSMIQAEMGGGAMGGALPKQSMPPMYQGPTGG